MREVTQTNTNPEAYARRLPFLNSMGGGWRHSTDRNRLISRRGPHPQSDMVTLLAGTREAFIGEKNFQFKNIQVHDLLSVAVRALKKHAARRVLRAVQQWK